VLNHMSSISIAIAFEVDRKLSQHVGMIPDARTRCSSPKIGIGAQLLVIALSIATARWLCANWGRVVLSGS
jgi:hypothetical protein